MALRSGHGNGRGMPRVEVSPCDELPVGQPAVTRPAPLRNASGQLQPSAGTTELARAAGKAAGESRQLARLLGLWTPPGSHEYAPYHRLASEWRDAHLAQLSATVGGGEVGPGPASIVSTAAIQLGASRYLADVGARDGDAKMILAASRLADSSRQNLLAGHELVALEAEARTKTNKQSGKPTWQIASERALAAGRASEAERLRLVSAASTSAPGDAATGQPGPSNEVSS